MRVLSRMVSTGKSLIPVAIMLLTGSVVVAKTTGPAREEITRVIIHATGGPGCKSNQVVFTPSGTLESMKRYFEQHPTLGIHYLIGRRGAIAKSIPEDQVANHAYGHNKTSIGIELINRGDGYDPYPEAQIASLIQLLKEIREHHSIRMEEIEGHSDIDDRTFRCGAIVVKGKQDPGANFPWERVKRELARGCAEPGEPSVP